MRCYLVRLSSTIVVYRSHAEDNEADESHIQEVHAKRVRLQRAASIIVAAQQAAIVAAHQAVLQAQHAHVLQRALDAAYMSDGSSDDEWLIAHEYENEEWEEGV